jgi:hypothetical protein
MTTPNDQHPMHPASVRFSVEALWIGESRFAEGHPSSLVNDIASEFAEATNDMCIYLDNLAAVDLEHANVDWRESMAMNLERDLNHVSTLVRNAMKLARNLRLEGDPDEG